MKVQVQFTDTTSREGDDVPLEVGDEVTGESVCRAVQDYYGELEEGDQPFTVESWLAASAGSDQFAFILRWPKGDYSLDTLIVGIVDARQFG